MKTIIFILLKIGELALLPLVYLLFCFAGKYLMPVFGMIGPYQSLFNIMYFAFGLITIGISICIILLCFQLIQHIPDWIDKNKEWAESIVNKLKRK
jgi:uncharacterized membrane protein